MRNQKGNENVYGVNKREELVAVGIDKDKHSQYALKWAVDHLLTRGQTISLVHVKPPLSSTMGNHVALSENQSKLVEKAIRTQIDNHVKEVFLPFRAFCSRRNILAKEVILEDMDIANALCNYVKVNLVETLVVGAPSKGIFLKKLMGLDVPAAISKSAPDFCSIYVISKGKISSVKSASVPVPNPPPRPLPSVIPIPRAEMTSYTHQNFMEDTEIKSALKGHHESHYSYSDNDQSYMSSERTSPEHIFTPSDFQGLSGVSYGSDSENIMSIGSPYSTIKSPDFSSSYNSDSDNMLWSSSQEQDEVEAEMRRLKLELKQTMDMYSTACRDALTAKQKAAELHQWKMETQNRAKQSLLTEETTAEVIEKEKAKTRAAIEAAEAAQRMAEMEVKKRMHAEKMARKEAEERRKVEDELARSDVRYRKYGIEEIEAATDHFDISRKVGEGGYGPVYKCYLDHTPVAVKVLRPDAAQGRSQFQQEVGVLSCIRHPNMVLLLGACPEYGCLVYEYMGNGSLEDCIFGKNNTFVLPWQLRFKIAAEIATGLLFLHQAKPEPLVHRDLKPANILLDKNFVSKISDVGLARLVPPEVFDSVTQYRMTSTAGTFCYIDPEYQQTGMLGTKSDIYSLGIMLLQIITAKPPMGLTYHVERAIEKGTFADILDPSVSDWPVEDALIFAKIALKCAELRRKDRPDLKNEILPELNRLRAMGEEGMTANFMMGTPRSSPCQSQISSLSHEMNSEYSQSTMGSSYN